MRIYFKQVPQHQRIKLEERWLWNAVMIDKSSHSKLLPVFVDCEVMCEHEQMELTGTLSVQMHLECSRCLHKFTHSLIVPIHEIFVRNTMQQEQVEVNIHQVNTDEIELDPYFEENIVLALPYVPLCDTSCKGLCKICGLNLNVSHCSCKVEYADSRFAMLSDYFKNK